MPGDFTEKNWVFFGSLSPIYFEYGCLAGPGAIFMSTAQAPNSLR